MVTVSKNVASQPAEIYGLFAGKHQGQASFSLLTLNADAHPVLNRMHKPEDEKRSLFIVPPEEYDLWLGATPDEARAMLMLLPPERFSLAPAPKGAPKTSPPSHADLGV